MDAPQIEQHCFLLRRRQVAEARAKEKAVQLRLGQRKSAFVLDGILRGQNKKRTRQRTCVAVHSNLALAHGFQQGSLGARRGPVDFVGKQNVGEGRAGKKLKGARLLVEDAHTGNVAGQQVGRALQPAEVGVEAARQRACQHCLANAGHIFKQHVAVAQQGNHQQFNDFALADYDFFDVANQRIGKGTHFCNGGSGLFACLQMLLQAQVDSTPFGHLPLDHAGIALVYPTSWLIAREVTQRQPRAKARPCAQLQMLSTHSPHLLHICTVE